MNSPPPIPQIMVASPPFASAFLLIAAVALLVSSATSQTCKSQTFVQANTKFSNCKDLPTLKAQLHWTYEPLAKPTPTLNIAYTAPPAKPDGWVAWALNPTGSGMIGAQALIAFKDTDRSVVVKTYNISSYRSITESRISYEVLSKRAEHSDGVMKIFATLALPAGSTVVNQVWQVGASVKDGVPVKHDFSTENLSSKGTLQLAGDAVVDNNGAGPVPAPAPAPVSGRGGPASGTTRRNDNWIINGSGLRLYGVMMLLVAVLGF